MKHNTLKNITIFVACYVLLAIFLKFSIEKIFFTVLSFIFFIPIICVLAKLGKKIKKDEEKIKNPTLNKVNKYGGYILLVVIIITIVIALCLLEHSLS